MSIQQVVQLVVSLAAFFIFSKSLQLRDIPLTRYFTPLALAVFFYAIGYLLELDAHTLESAFFGQRVRYCGVSCYAVFFYLFVRDCGERPVSRRWVPPLLLIFPAVILFLVNTWPMSNLYFADLSFTTVPSPHLIIQRGPLFHLHVIYSYALITLSAYEVLRHYPKNTGADRFKRTAFLLGTLLPNIAIIIFTFQQLHLPMQFGSMALVVALLLLGSYVLRYRAQDWLPYAHSRVVDTMQDGYILVDAQGRLLDANEAAKKYFPGLQELGSGQPLDLPNTNLAALCSTAGNTKDLILHTEGHTTYLRASQNPIMHAGQQVCTSILLYDVTETHQLMERLENMATHDQMTRLFNHVHFIELAGRDFAISVREKTPLTLLMLDIDHFKRVNDRFGHPVGDTVLVQIARAMKERLRQTDIIGRYGGEEFCALLPSTDIWGGLQLANDIRTSIEYMPFHSPDGAFHVTVSIGLAQRDAGRHPDLSALVADADAALYQAKNEGRNRVIPHSSSFGGALQGSVGGAGNRRAPAQGMFSAGHQA